MERKLYLFFYSNVINTTQYRGWAAHDFLPT